MSRARTTLGANAGGVRVTARAPRRRRRAALGLIGCALCVTFATATCQRADTQPRATGTVTLVNRVHAAVRGLSCATCPATVEAALRERLGPAAIAIDPGHSVEVAFEQSGSTFPSASFRSALAQGGGEALSISIEACGTIQAMGEQAWLTSGTTRLLLEGVPPATGEEVCVTGELRDQTSPPRLRLAKFGG